MIIVSYDFENNKKRNRFCKFLKKYGYRIQYSVFNIKNSPRILKNIVSEIDHKYKKFFDNTDSIIIVNLCESCVKKIIKYGYSSNDDKDIVIFN